MILLVVVIIVVGILLWLADQRLKPIMDPLIYKLLVLVVILALVLYILKAFGLLPGGMAVPRVS